jgi:hypothetical protein
VISASIRDENGATLFEWPGIIIEARDVTPMRNGLRCNLRVLDTNVPEAAVIGRGNVDVDDLRQRREFVASLAQRDGKVPDWDARLILVAETLHQRLSNRRIEFVVTPLKEFMEKSWEAGESIIDELINIGDIVWWYGQVGHGKTLQACECCIAVAAGRCAFTAFSARQGSALIIAEDMHPQMYQGYLRMLLDAYGVDNAPIYIWPRQFLRLDDDVAADAFTAKILELGPRLIVFDAFLDLHMGDGFAGRELRPVLDRIVALPQLLPCAVIVLDHPRKEAQGNKLQGDPIDTLYGGRLKSALADTMILTKRTGDAPPRFTLSIVKSRKEPRAPITVTFSSEDGFVIDDSPVGLTPAANSVYQWARGLPAGSVFSKKHMEDGAKVSTRTADAAVNELRFNRMLEEAAKVGRAKGYRLTTVKETKERTTGRQQPLSDIVPGGIHQDAGGVD